MLIYKNYKLKKEILGGLHAIEIRYSDCEVFCDLPICKVPFEFEIEEPFLLKNGTVISKKDLVKALENQKIFHLKANDKGIVQEVDSKEATHHISLPKDTDVSLLAIENNEVVMIEKQNTRKDD